MTRYNLRANLSLNGIDSLLKKTTALEEGLPKVNKLFIRKSVDYLDERAKFHLGMSIGHSWYIPSGALMSSFQKVYGADFGRLFNNCFTALWVEYGTGIVGSGTHPDPKGYQYDVNNHGEDGWVYKDKEGNYHFTRGMEAHRYMYNALIDYLTGGVKRMYSEAFDEVLGGILKS